MSQFRYVGGAPAQIMYTNYDFRIFGQLVDMPDDLAEHAILNRIHLVPLDIFSARFTPEELKKYARFETHENAPQEFKDKLVSIWKEAQEMHHAMRNNMTVAAPLNDMKEGDSNA